MKKRTAFIGSILSLIPFRKSLTIKTGFILLTSGLIFSVPENVFAKDNVFYFNRAIDKQKSGDYYGAISDYNKAIEINPYDADSYYNRGNIKARDLKDYVGSLYDLNKAIDINPNNDQMYISRCLVKANLKDYYGAISDCTKAIEINPKDGKAYINRGVSKFAIRDNEGACFDARKGKSLGASNGSKAVELLCN